VTTLRATRKKVAKLQLTKIELLMEIENLKAKAQEKIDSLENEVQQLRDEVNEFQKLLDSI